MNKGRYRLRRGVLPLCMGGALLAHVALLGLVPDAVHRWQLERLQAHPVATPVALTVRYLTSPAPVDAALEAITETPLVPDRPEAGPEPSPEQVAPEPAGAATPVTEPGVYVPRALLSVAPVARGPVQLLWPQNWPLKASYTAILKLYLDDQGRVERVEADGGTTLPEPLFESARQAFAAAGFTPGQLNGRAVKSWIRVEVTFESETRPVER